MFLSVNYRSVTCESKQKFILYNLATGSDVLCNVMLLWDLRLSSAALFTWGLNVKTISLVFRGWRFPSLCEKNFKKSQIIQAFIELSLNGRCATKIHKCSFKSLSMCQQLEVWFWLDDFVWFSQAHVPLTPAFWFFLQTVKVALA